jgi:hypothetical protein
MLKMLKDGSKLLLLEEAGPDVPLLELRHPEGYDQAQPPTVRRATA